MILKQQADYFKASCSTFCWLKQSEGAFPCKKKKTVLGQPSALIISKFSYGSEGHLEAMTESYVEGYWFRILSCL